MSVGESSPRETIERLLPGDILERILLAGVLLAVIAAHAPGTASRFNAFDVATVYVAFAAVAIVLDGLRTRDAPMAVLQLIATGVVLLAILRQGEWGGVPEATREIQIALLLVLFLAYPFVGRDGLDRLRRLGPFVLGAALVLGVHFHHVVGLPSGSGLAGFPIFVGLFLAMNLFFFPRYVSRKGFFWAVGRVAALVVLLGLVAYVVGPFEFFGAQVDIRREHLGYPLLTQLDVMESVFPNPNGLGLLAFGGTVAAAIETHERYEWLTDERGRAPLREVGTAISAGLAVICGLGIVLSGSRGPVLATVLALGMYGGAVYWGRDALPSITAVTMGGFVVFLGLIYFSLLPFGTGRRFVLWRAAIEAYLANPTLYGEGIVGTGDLLVPFHALENQPTPHNSYLQILLRAGIVGLIGYVVLTIGSLVDALARHRVVDLAAFAFASGWAVHQLFEAYTMFHFVFGSVIASLAVGFLIHGREPYLFDESDGLAGWIR